MSPLAHAIGLSKALLHTPYPRACPICFIILGLDLGAASRQKTPLLEELRDKRPDFWDACLCFLTTSRTTDDFPALRKQLHRNLVGCPNRICHLRVREDGLADPIHALVEALYMVLQACLVYGSHPTVQGIKALKSFGKRGRWPESADKLFPFGPQQTIDMHVFWCSLRFSVVPMAFLGDTLHLARPLTLPHLAASNATRSKLVYILAQMLQADFSRVPDEWEGELPVTPACDANLPLSPPSYDREGVIEAATEFLKALILGLDVRQLDFRPLFLGYGRVMSKAVEAASRTMDTSAFYFPLLSTFAHLCHITYDLPSNTVSARLRASWPQVGLGAPQSIPSNALRVWHNLTQLSRMRSCSSPGCAKTVHVNGGRPLALCGNCKTTRYCGKECQQRHWKHAKDPHKVICPLLRRLLVEASPGMPLEQFAAAFEKTLLENERDRLQRWSEETAGFPSTNFQ